LESLDGGGDNFGLFAADRAGFAGVGIQARYRDARSGDSAAAEESFEQPSHPDNLFCAQRTRDVAQWKMNGNESDREFPAGEEHGEVANPASVREKLGLAREFEADIVHSRLINWTGDDGVDFTAECELDAFLEGLVRGAGRFLCWFA
jgi:hypothetical protein